MKVGKKIQELAAFVEFLVGSGLAIFFHVVLNNEQTALAIFAIGILLSLSTYLVREEVEKSRKGLEHQYRQAHEIPSALGRIRDPECQSKASELTGSLLKTLGMLELGYIPLEEMEFYLEGARMCDHAKHRLKAVDPLTDGWLSRGVLVNYYHANLRALDRGVRITRIFVASREELANPEAQKVIISQHRNNIDIRIAFRDELPAAMDISGRNGTSSFDFAIYDDRVATEVFPQTGKYHGRKTSDPAEVGKYRHLYDLIEHSAHVVTLEDEKVVLVAEVLATQLS